jgi:dolichyl-phosphate-mannose-protein mannosyltransferase
VASAASAIGEAPEWRPIDTIVVGTAVLAALVTRLWRIAAIPVPIFDERLTLYLARSYVSGDPALFVHPPLEALLVAAGIIVFGDHAPIWRLPNAILGTALVAITYLLGRRMFGSRLAGALAAGAVILDGMFLVSSRIATTTAVEVTFFAWSYLLALRAVQVRALGSRRRTLAALAIMLGLALGTKLAVPLVTCVLVTGLLVWSISRRRDDSRIGAAREVAATLAMLAGIGGLVYLAIFIPNWRFGWWLGIGDFVRYHLWAAQTHLALPPDHPQASPWWSWPLMLRPFAYWIYHTVPPQPVSVVAVWCGGNPALWWAGLAAVIVLTIRTVERPSPAGALIVIGYVAYLAMWLPVRRYIFIYDYAPPLYLAYIALAATLAALWMGATRAWEQIVMLATLAPTLLLGLGPRLGATALAVLTIVYLIVLARGGVNSAGRFVFLAIVAAALILFFYFLPVWMPQLLTPAQYFARMWLRGPGLLDWR